MDQDKRDSGACDLNNSNHNDSIFLKNASINTPLAAEVSILNFVFNIFFQIDMMISELEWKWIWLSESTPFSYLVLGYLDSCLQWTLFIKADWSYPSLGYPLTYSSLFILWPILCFLLHSQTLHYLLSSPLSLEHQPSKRASNTFLS